MGIEKFGSHKKVYTAAEIGAPIQPEAIPSKELFRASLGFDFVFGMKDGKKHPYCVEINSNNTGIAGAQKVAEEDSTRKILANIRDQRDPEYLYRVREAIAIEDDLLSGEFPATELGKGDIKNFLSKSIKSKRMFPMSINNDVLLDEIARNKQMQEKFIPAEFLPRTLHRDDTDRISKTGSWIVKPKKGLGGGGAMIFHSDEIDSVLEDNEDIIWDATVIQEFIPPLGAEEAGREMQGHAASMRLLIDFRYLESGDIDPMYEYAYQRVAKEPYNKDNRPGQREEAGVVNLSRGSLAFPASSEEYELAHHAAEEIIHNIAKIYPKDHTDNETVD